MDPEIRPAVPEPRDPVEEAEAEAEEVVVEEVVVEEVEEVVEEVVEEGRLDQLRAPARQWSSCRIGVERIDVARRLGAFLDGLPLGNGAAFSELQPLHHSDEDLEHERFDVLSFARIAREYRDMPGDPEDLAYLRKNFISVLLHRIEVRHADDVWNVRVLSEGVQDVGRLRYGALVAGMHQKDEPEHAL